MTKLSPYASVSETRKVLERHGLATKHSLGQNFLINDGILQKIVTLAELTETDDVLEIGPGIGTLTVALLQTAHSVTSIEFDPDLPAVLAETTAPWAQRFALIENDALAVQKSAITQALACIYAGGEEVGSAQANQANQADQETQQNQVRSFPDKLISNLPYAVAATVVLDYFQRFSELESMTVMVQKEVADRMCARPGVKDYSAFTVKLSFYAQAAGRFSVAPSNFFPPPRVDSAVIRLDRHTCCDEQGKQLTKEEVQAACLMADAAFATRRKTLANSCKTFFNARGAQGKSVAQQLPLIFEQAGIDARKRGETLVQQEFIALARAYLVHQKSGESKENFHND